MLLLLLLACATPASAPPRLAWDFDARPTTGAVRVLPLVRLYEEPSIVRDEYVVGTVGWERVPLRRARMEEVAAVPDAFARALPGAINGAVGAWEGRFSPGHWPLGARERVGAALEDRRDLERALGDAARALGEPVLVTWVRELDGRPLSAEGYPGDLLATSRGPVAIDPGDEPYRVRARVGVALVDASGDVVLRFEEDGEALLSSFVPPSRTGRELAKQLAGDVALVWPGDPRLGDDALAQR